MGTLLTGPSSNIGGGGEGGEGKTSSGAGGNGSSKGGGGGGNAQFEEKLASSPGGGGGGSGSSMGMRIKVSLDNSLLFASANPRRGLEGITGNSSPVLRGPQHPKTTELHKLAFTLSKAICHHINFPQ